MISPTIGPRVPLVGRWGGANVQPRHGAAHTPSACSSPRSNAAAASPIRIAGAVCRIYTSNVGRASDASEFMTRTAASARTGSRIPPDRNMRVDTSAGGARGRSPATPPRSRARCTHADRSCHQRGWSSGVACITSVVLGMPGSTTSASARASAIINMRRTLYVHRTSADHCRSVEGRPQ